MIKQLVFPVALLAQNRLRAVHLQWAMLRSLLAMLEARRARARAEQWAEHVRRVEAARLAEFPDSAGYSWGMQVVSNGRLLPRRRLLRPTPRRRRRQRRPVEPEEEPEPDPDIVYL